jgi:hypothetical protein
LATHGDIPVVVTATGSEMPEKVLHEEEEQEVESARISMTDPEEMSLVTQTSLWLSTAIPVGFEKEFNPEKLGQVELVQVALLMAVVVISVTDPEEVSLVTQTLLWLSTAIPVGLEK